MSETKKGPENAPEKALEKTPEQAVAKAPEKSGGNAPANAAEKGAATTPTPAGAKTADKVPEKVAVKGDGKPAAKVPAQRPVVRVADGPRVVVPNTSFRDAMLAIVMGLLVLGFMSFGAMKFFQQSRDAQASKLTGTITEKVFTAAPEEQITLGGRKGLQTKKIDGEFVLKVRIDKSERVYEVPVEKEVYQKKNVGDSLTFLRPRSER